MNRINIFSLPCIVVAMAVIFVSMLSAGAATYTWNDPGGNSGDWSTSTNWTLNTPGAGPTAVDTAVFGNNDTTTSPSTVNNTVDSGFAGTVSNLTYNSSALPASPVYDVTQILPGQTLTVSGTLLAGGVNEVNTAAATEAYMVGGGNLVVTGTNLMVQNYDNTTRAGTTAYLNLSGLSNFVYYNTNGTIRIEDRLPSDSTDTGLGGNMVLASVSNSITAASLNLGTSTSAQAGAAGTLGLGAGTNIINASSINISSEKSTFTVTNSGGGLRIRGKTGADSDSSVNITLGDKNAGNGGTGSIIGSLLLNGCAVNIKAGTLIVGENVNSQPGASVDGGTGILQFDTGTMSANSVIMADNASPNNGTVLANCSGTIQVGPNATLLIGAGQLFALATAASSGPSTGTLIVSNGLVNCQGPLSMGVGTNSIPPSSAGTNTGIIQLVGRGTLNMGPNSYIGTVTNPVTSLILDTNSTLSLSIPSVSYTNICVQNLNWPSPDNNLTISVAAMPAGINPGAVFPFLNFSGTMTNAFNSPNLLLPPGVSGSLSLAPGATTMYLTITAGVGPGYGGVNQLLNPFFALSPLGTGWTGAGGASVVSTNSTYPNTSSCTHDTRNIIPLPFSGTNVAKLTGSFVAGGSTNVWSQSVPIAPGSTITPGASTYVAHEDMMSGADSFYYEVDFLNSTGGLVAAYESPVLSNLTCGSAYLDTWNLTAITNQMQITGGVNTGVVASNVAPIIQIPPQVTTARFEAIFIQRNATDTGSVYFSGANVGLLANPVPPTISSVTPNLTTLCTNTTLSCVVTSTITTISSIQVTATTTTLAGSTTNTTVYNVGSPGLTVTGLGTSSADLSLTLAANAIYQSVVFSATDADGLAISSSPVSFDTLTPTLVIEGSDFNFTSNGISGFFFDTPPNGGVALYTNQIGFEGIDEHKIARTNTQSYYRPGDATIIQAANPAAPSGTEQKFITAASNGDARDIEVAVAFDTSGDWQNYSRTFGPTIGLDSAPAGTYNVWCYLATSGSGPQVGFYQVTSDPTAPGQTTNFIGNFGSSSFTDNGYNTFVYAPLVDQFGNRVSLTVGNGVQTFRGQIANSDTPNVGFYMLVPVVPIFNPVFLNVYPNTTFEATNVFTFSVGPAQGASISTNGIGLTINGVPVSSGLSFIALANGGWTVNYAIQSNEMYSVVIDVTNTDGLTATYANSFDTFNLNNFHWMAVDYDFSTNNGTGTLANNGDDGTGGSVGDGWTGGLFIDNPMPTGATNAPVGNATWQYATNSYFGWPSGYTPNIDPNSFGAVAQQSIDVNWETNLTQDPGLIVSNSIYRLSSNPAYGDGVGSQIASDSFLLPEFIKARTNTIFGSDGNSGGPDGGICEFNIGYFYSGDWLNYTRTYPTGTFNVWGRLAAGAGAFTGCTLSLVTSGVGTSNQTTQVLGTFSDAAPAGWQAYHWIPLVDTNGNPVYVQLSGQETLRLTAPTNASPSGDGLNPLFFMLAPATPPALEFHISAAVLSGDIQISIPTQSGHIYTLWHAATLTGAWTQVGGSIPGNGSVQVIPEPASGTQGYYRVTTQ